MTAPCRPAPPALLRALAPALLASLALGCDLSALPSAPSDGGPAADRGGMSSIGAGESRQLYYQWVDEAGRVQFSERLEQVPRAWRDKVGYVEMAGSPPASPAEARRARAGAAGRGSSRAAEAGTPEVLLYGADWCPQCRLARKHLDRLGIPYDYRDVDRPATRDELVERTGQRGIPVIDVSGRVLIGYERSRLDQLLQAASG